MHAVGTDEEYRGSYCLRHGGEPGIAELMRRWWQIIKEFSNKHISCLSIALGTQHIFTSLYMGHINILCCQSRGIDISSMYIAKHIYTACCMVLTEPLSSPCIHNRCWHYWWRYRCFRRRLLWTWWKCEQFFGYIIKGRNIQIHKT